jgi:hypothetical protein
MTDSSLAGKPLRYLIGADADVIVAHVGEVVEVPFDWNAAAPADAIGIKYVNLFNENYKNQDTATRVSYGPYLTSSDTAIEYDEGQIDPHGPGWTKNLTVQFARAQAQGFVYIELDNPDAYSLSDVMGAIALAETYGLKVIAKNPGLSYGGDDATQAVAHPNVFGIIVESGAGTPAEMDAMRQRAGKSDLPVWFVFFGAAADEAQRTAVLGAKYFDIGVTYSSQGEYGSSVDILRPITSSSASVSPQPSPSSMTEPAHLAYARSLIGKVQDGPTIPPLAKQVGAVFPEMASYASLAGPATSWCGILCAASLATASKIRPPFGPTDTDRWMWADAWRTQDWGAGHVTVPQSGDVLTFDFGGGDHHVTFYVSSSGSNYVCLGGNQSDQVKESNYPASQCTGIMRPPAAGIVVQSSSPAPQPQTSAVAFSQSGKGSWYSQFVGKYKWVDNGDAPGSAALGVPDNAQGVSFYDHSTLGKWFQVRAPNGVVSIEQQTDIGPSPGTGRLIDISAAAAERFGYSPSNFPTDSIFSWQQTNPPAAVASLTPQQQAAAYRDLRGINGEVLSPDKPAAPSTAPASPASPAAPGAAAPNNQFMLIVLMMLLKEKAMADQTGKTPGQVLDALNASLLPMILNAAASGKQINPADLLPIVLQSVTGIALPAPAAPASSPAATSATPASGTTTAPPDLMSILLPLLLQQITGKPLALPAPTATATPAPAPAASAAPAAPAPAASTTPAWMINLGGGIASVVGSLILSKLGVMGAPVGPDATMTGALVPLIGAGLSALGLPAPLVAGLQTIVSKITAKAPAAAPAPAAQPKA